MKRLVRYATAALLAIVIALPGGARPAQAFNPVVVKQYVDLANSAYKLIKNVLGGGGGDAAIRAAVAEINAAIDAAKADILSHMDALATAEARACARHAVIEFADIENFSPQTLQTWAQNVTACVTLIDSLLSVVGDKAQLDLLGLSLNTAGPIAMAARAKAGLSTTALNATLQQGNNKVVQKLEPQCTFHPLWGDAAPGWGPVEVIVRCTSYPGVSSSDWVMGWGERYSDFWVNESDYAHVVKAASDQTSRAVALAALPELQN